jgi:hypothetical protein
VTSDQDERFRVGVSANAFVVIGVAEAGANTSPRYTMLWRRVEGGAFTPLGSGLPYTAQRSFEVQTESSGSVRVRGVPGEFFMIELPPGTYALDSVFAEVRENRVSYVANGVVQGPARPAFDVRAGEAVYLGIWETNLDEVVAVARLWRLDQGDLRAVLRRGRNVVGEVSVRQTQMRAVPCAPRRLSSNSQRQVC